MPTPGDLVNLPDSCPAACVYWAEDGTAWATVRTRRQARTEGTSPYRLVGPLDDPDSFDITAPPPILPPPEDPPDVVMVKAAFPGAEVTGYDHERMRYAVSEVLAYYSARRPEVFEHRAWQRLAEAEDGTDQEMVDAAGAAVRWCRQETPDRLKQGGWQAIVRLIADYAE